MAADQAALAAVPADGVEASCAAHCAYAPTDMAAIKADTTGFQTIGCRTRKDDSEIWDQ